MRDNDKSKSEIWDRQTHYFHKKKRKKKNPKVLFSGLDHIKVGTEGRMIGIILSSLWHLSLLIIAVIGVVTTIIITIVIAVVVSAIVVSIAACIITACRRAVFRLVCLPGWILNDILAILWLRVCLA